MRNGVQKQQKKGSLREVKDFKRCCNFCNNVRVEVKSDLILQQKERKYI